jgi:hypothetical protein
MMSAQEAGPAWHEIVRDTLKAVAGTGVKR